jgi:hypothetical protein
MAATPQPSWSPPRTERWGVGRVLALVFGLLFLLPALGLLIGGGVLLWADGAGRTDDGYVVSGEERFATQGYAIVSERIDLTTGADWIPLSATLGAVRIEVTGVDPDKEVFLGLAPVAEGSAYLAGVEHTVIDDFGVDAPASSRVLLPGGPPPGPPVTQDFWVAESSGPGTRQLTWTPAEGDWMFVIMNADGSAGVTVDARIGATVPALGGLGWGLLISGLLCLLIGLLMIVLAIRRRSADVGPSGGVVPTQGSWGPPPAWPASPAATDRTDSAPVPGPASSPGGPAAPGRDDVRREP